MIGIENITTFILNLKTTVPALRCKKSVSICMKFIKEIIHNQFGSIMSDQLGQLAREYSELPLAIKWAYAPRECHPASEIIRKIKEGIHTIMCEKYLSYLRYKIKRTIPSMRYQFYYYFCLVVRLIHH